MEENIFRHKLPRFARYCPFCCEDTVYMIPGHPRIGRCEKCNHARQIPPPYEMLDTMNPAEEKFLIDLLKSSLYPKHLRNNIKKFKGNIHSQGIIYN